MTKLYCFRCCNEIEYTKAARLVCPRCSYTREVDFLDGERAELHSKAEFYLCDGQFFNALKMYEILLKEDNEDKMALFGAVLSEYGAKYKDNYDGTYSFICERTLSLSVYENRHCKKLLELSFGKELDEYKKIINLIAKEQEKNNQSYLENAPIEQSRDYRAEARADDRELAPEYIAAQKKYLREQEEQQASELEKKEAEKQKAETAARAREKRLMLEAKREKRKKTALRLTAVFSALAILAALTFTLIIPEIRYSIALSDIENGNFDNAARTLRSLGSFKNSRELSEKYKFFGLEISDTVIVGKYEQDANLNNGKEDIEWTVIANDENTVTLLSKHVLDCVPYDKEKTKPSYWESSYLRSWLSEDFSVCAFSEQELSVITERLNKNLDNDEYQTLGGKDTADKIWVLSLDEAHSLSSEILISSPTAYAISMGVYQKEGFEGTNYWLRSSGDTQNKAAYISYENEITARGSSVNNTNYGIRVCITVNKTDSLT